VDYDDAWNRTTENLHGLKGLAEQLGVTIGVENVWNNFLLSPLEMRDLIDQIASPRVGVYLDVGNVVKFGFPEMWVKILGSRIARVHVKDYKRDVGTMGGFVDLLAGDVDFPAVVSALQKTGYDGPLTVEIGAEGCFPEDNVFRTARAMEKILGKR
jgi:hexulose-6-phosphate isomerase